MIFHKPKSNKSNRKEFEAQLLKFNNKSCIYFKNPSVCYGRLGEYSINETGLELTLHCQEAASLDRLSPQLELYGVWEDLSIMKRHIICYDESWHLFFDENLITEILNIAGNDVSREDRLLEIMDRILNFLAQES
jgi:hypothetical protein